MPDNLCRSDSFRIGGRRGETLYSFVGLLKEVGSVGDMFSAAECFGKMWTFQVEKKGHEPRSRRLQKPRSGCRTWRDNVLILEKAQIPETCEGFSACFCPLQSTTCGIKKIS
jgi:hypothetical protein